MLLLPRVMLPRQVARWSSMLWCRWDSTPSRPWLSSGQIYNREYYQRGPPLYSLACVAGVYLINSVIRNLSCTPLHLTQPYSPCIRCNVHCTQRILTTQLNEIHHPGPLYSILYDLQRKQDMRQFIGTVSRDYVYDLVFCFVNLLYSRNAAKTAKTAEGYFSILIFLAAGSQEFMSSFSQ